MENAQRIMLLLPLLRRKLKSVISNGNCKLRIFFVLKILIVVFLVFLVSLKKYGGSGYLHLKHAALLKLKHTALFLIMQLVLGLIVLRASIMLRVDLARVRLPLIISLLPKKTAPVFLTQLVCIIFSRHSVI